MNRPGESDRRNADRLYYGFGNAVISICGFSFATLEAFRRLVGRPPVRTISTDQVRRLMAEADSTIVLVDVRARGEQAVADAGVATKNYQASVIGWCRCGLPLETADGRATFKVHPYWRIFRVPDNYEVQT